VAAAPTIVRIAHAAGNRRDRIAGALAAGVDLIEIDVRWRHEAAWVRHERRLPFLPVLYDRDLRGVHRGGPYAATLGRHFFRLELRGLRFRDAVALVGDGAGLLVDLKAAPYRTSEARRFVANLLTTLAGFAGTLDFCGGWPLLDLVTEARPGQRVHYSVDKAGHWDALVRRMEGGTAPSGISIHPRLLGAERAETLRRAGIDFYCWDIDDAAAAEQAIALGASGINADDLDLLAALRGRTAGGD
jgi:glycerophosphoryl diester phosphodiesterase